MSATNRTRKDSSDYQRAENDYYRTPTWTTKAIAAYLPPETSHADISRQLFIVDAGAGDGAIALASGYANPVCIDTNRALAQACEKHGFVALTNNFVEYMPERTVDVLLSNPPYSAAIEFIHHALCLIGTTGMAAFLLRLNFLEGQGRADFHKKNPAHVLVLPRRPSFTANGGTDATGYAWFLWGKNPGAEKSIVQGRWEILDVPAGVRQSRQIVETID